MHKTNRKGADICNDSYGGSSVKSINNDNVKDSGGSNNKGNSCINNSRMAAAAIIVMSSMVFSRLTGFIREIALSWKLGLDWTHDAYIAAFAIPDLLYVLLVAGMIAAALVPFISGSLEKGEEKEGWDAASSFINLIIISTIILCIVGVVFAPQIIPLVAPGFSEKSPHTKELAIILARILFPSVFFIMLAGICNGVLNSYRKFAAAAYGPSIYNIGCAISIFLFADTNPESMIRTAIGVSASAFIYFIVQLLFTLPKLKLYKIAINLYDKGLKKLISQAVPSIMSSSVTQINMIISTAFVSLSAVEGSLAAFRNANTVWQLPYGIFAMGIGTAMLPALSGKYATKDFSEYKSLLMKSLTSVLYLAVPSAVGFIVLREPLIRAIFNWGGRFTESNVPFVASILVLFSLAMISQSVVAIMNRAFYAGQDTKTPLYTGLGTIILNIVFCVLFYHFTGFGAAGMALSYSIISTVNSVMLLLLLNKKLKGIQLKKLFGFAKGVVPSVMVMGAALYILELLPVDYYSKSMQLLYLAFEILMGAAVYITMTFVLKADIALYLINLVINLVKSKLKK